MIKDIKVPEISENVESGTVVAVLVKTGDWVEPDDPVVELETDKAVVEIPSPFAGKITEVLVNEGDEVKIGAVIARLDTESQPADEAPKEEPGESAPEESPPEKEEKTEQAPEPKDDRPEPVPEAEEKTDKEKKEKPPPSREKEKVPESQADREPVPASPSVRRLARELGVDIYAVAAGKPDSRITEEDVKAHVKQGAAHPPVDTGTPTRTAAARSPELPDFSRWGKIEAVDLPTVRRLTSDSVSVSWTIIPHVTQFDRADIGALQDFIRKKKDSVARAGGKLTVTAVLMQVCAKALLKFPQFNSSIDTANAKLILKHYVNIGMMTDTPRGLLVPVIRNADRKNITELAVEISDLADRARNKKVKPDELEGGTFSISNQGGIGGTGFTPIVLWPQAAVLGVSRASTEPKFVDGEFRPREVMPLSLSYDHRIIDGADAARFLRWVCESLEQPFNMVLD